jgi:hypothetical protein
LRGSKTVCLRSEMTVSNVKPGGCLLLAGVILSRIWVYVCIPSRPIAQSLRIDIFPSPIYM